MSLIEKLKNVLGEARGGHRLTEQEVDMRVAVAVVLMAVAEADQDFQQAERDEIMSLLGNHFNLETEKAAELMELARNSRDHVPDLWPFTSALSRNLNPEQKFEVLVMIWRVVFADGHLDPYEDQLLRRLQTLIAVNHSVLMEAKKVARESV